LFIFKLIVDIGLLILSTLTLVRHGQASFSAEDYDQLSPLGEAQAQALGRYWAERALHFDAVYLGPLRRHQQTLAATQVALAPNPVPDSPWANPTVLPELEEHHGMFVFLHLLPELARRHDRLGQLAAPLLNGGSAQDRLQAYFLFTQLWALDELPSEPHESWAAFCLRVQQGLKQMMAQAESGQRIVAFTSGGVIAAAVGFALEVSAAKTIALNGMVQNGGFSEFRFSTRGKENRFSLSKFNATPHLDDPKLLTYI
jgi:broad specificity phosphatase PhoE